MAVVEFGGLGASKREVARWTQSLIDTLFREDAIFDNPKEGYRGPHPRYANLLAWIEESAHAVQPRAREMTRVASEKRSHRDGGEPQRAGGRTEDIGGICLVCRASGPIRRSSRASMTGHRRPPNLKRLAERWHRAPARWGHPLHSLCSYFAMFPPKVPHVFIRWLTEAGDVVYDPFSGRGTAPMEACRMGRIGMGSDANPLAHVLTAAKVDAPTTEEARARLSVLRGNCQPGDPSLAPPEIRMLYSERVLEQLLCLRDTLSLSRRDDRFLMALVLGVMHANFRPGKPARGLSISMPNTFSMSPGYVRGYIKEHQLAPPDVDVFDLLDRKLDRIVLPDTAAIRGSAWRRDARKPVARTIRERPAKLVFTSPPYLSVIKYGKYNWIRLWMLGQDPKAVDGRLVATASLAKYLAFMRTVLRQLAPAVREDGYLCLMIGDVLQRASGKVTNLAGRVWEDAAEPLGWHLRGIVADRLPTRHKVSRIWKQGRGQATKTDRVLILSPAGRQPERLPTLGRIRWKPAITWQAEG